MISPKAVLFSAAVFLVLVLVFRYVSLGSIAAVAAFPNIALALHEYGNAPLALALMSLASVLIVAKHHANIRRLLAGTENRFGSRHA
jgi:glycerol-3-phosphate acyltransferase PlsY